MAPTQAFFGCPGPATSVSATRVFPARLSRWRGTSGVAEIAENKFYVATGSSGTARVGSCRRHSGAIAKRQGVFHAHPKAKHRSGLPRPALQGKESGHMQPGASPAQAIQASLSSPFGFADFLSGDTAVRVARPVAVAETADAHNDQTAIVRLRQDGQDNLSITFYRVDDLSGAINGLHAGDAGYQAAVQARAYQMMSGGTSIDGPGYGNNEQTGLGHVNAGDLVAMQLTNNTHGNVYSGFAQANETANGQPVGHLWNYGLNTWGWEDTYGGGDRNYNDLIVQLDFTSAAGHGWIA